MSTMSTDDSVSLPFATISYPSDVTSASFPTLASVPSTTTTTLTTTDQIIIGVSCAAGVVVLGFLKFLWSSHREMRSLKKGKNIEGAFGSMRLGSAVC